MNAPEGPRLDIFALPNQTAILAALTLGMLGAVLLLGGGLGPVGSLGLFAFAFLATLSVFLGVHRRAARDASLAPAGEGLTRLRGALRQASERTGLRRPPSLLVCPGSSAPRVFGTPWRASLALGARTAECWEQDLKTGVRVPQIEATLLHELQHIKMGDHWRLGLVRASLVSLVWVALWLGALFVGWAAFLRVIMETFLQHEPVEWLTLATAQLDPISAAFLIESAPDLKPLGSSEEMRASWALFTPASAFMRVIPTVALWAFVAGILRLWLWPAMWRLRELYADAGATRIQGRDDALLASMLGALSGLPPRSVPARASGWTRLNEGARRHSRRAWATLQGWMPGAVAHLARSGGRLFSHHPDGAERSAALAEPERVVDDPARLRATLVVLLLLELVTGSPKSLLTFAPISMHVITLSALLMVALTGLLPRAALGRSGRTLILQAMAYVALARGALVLFGSALFMTTDPVELGDILATGVSAAAGYTGPLDAARLTSPAEAVMTALIHGIFEMVVISLTLGLGLWTLSRLFQRMLTWYGAGRRGRWVIMTGVWGVLGVTMGAIAGVILPGASWLAYGLVPGPGLRIVAGLSILGLLLGGMLFRRAERRYGRRCPSCEAPVEPAWTLGVSCAQCDTVMNPWLLHMPGDERPEALSLQAAPAPEAPPPASPPLGEVPSAGAREASHARRERIAGGILGAGGLFSLMVFVDAAWISGWVGMLVLLTTPFAAGYLAYRHRRRLTARWIYLSAALAWAVTSTALFSSPPSSWLPLGLWLSLSLWLVLGIATPTFALYRGAGLHLIAWGSLVSVWGLYMASRVDSTLIEDIVLSLSGTSMAPPLIFILCLNALGIYAVACGAAGVGWHIIREAYRELLPGGEGS